MPDILPILRKNKQRHFLDALEKNGLKIKDAKMISELVVTKILNDKTDEMKQHLMDAVLDRADELIRSVVEELKPIILESVTKTVSEEIANLTQNVKKGDQGEQGIPGPIGQIGPVGTPGRDGKPGKDG